MIDFVNFCNVTWFYNKNKLQNKNKIFNILLKFLENVNLLFFFSAISHCFTLKFVYEWLCLIRLGENVFQDSLPNLQKIFIRHAGLRTIHPTAFYNLKILIEAGCGKSYFFIIILFYIFKLYI